MSGRSQNPLKRIIGEIHRRSLWQVLAIYLVSGWVVYEAVQSLTEGLGLPGWFPALAFILLLIGLPIVLATAFVQEGGPGRGSSTPAAEPEETASGAKTGDEPAAPGIGALFTWRNAIAGGVLAFALWGVVAAAWVLFGSRTSPPTVVGPAGAEGGRPKSIAVLPFDNLSPNPEEDRYFSDGVHDEILTELSKVGELKVISRTSVLAYRNTTKNLRAIARELNVATVLEGSVRRAQDRVRITAQLIDARSDEHIWAHTYERSLDDIFMIQADVARQIAGALHAELTDGEGAPERRPTKSLAAYDLYLRARQIGEQASGTEYQPHARRAIELYRQALELDPEFAAAHAGLGRSLLVLYGHLFDLNTAVLREGRAAVRRALELDPELPEAHLARAFDLGWIQGDQEGEEARLRRVLELQPNHAEAILLLALRAEAEGEVVEARRRLTRARELDPGDFAPVLQLAWLQTRDGEHRNAIATLEEAASRFPENLRVRGGLAALHLAMGDTSRTRTVLANAVKAFGAEPLVRFMVEQDLVWAVPWTPGADEILRGIEPASFGSDSLAVLYLHRVKSLERERAGDPEGAQAAALAGLSLATHLLEQEPLPPVMKSWLHYERGFAEAILGRRDDAISDLRRSVELASSGGSVESIQARERLAEVLVRVGRVDDAVDVLSFLLEERWSGTPAYLRVAPELEPIRDHPRFQALLEEYEER